jgi:hypothetical protein
MMHVILRKQQLILIYLSLGISALLLLLRISFLPHSLMYLVIYVVIPVFSIFSRPYIYTLLALTIVLLAFLIYSFGHGIIAFSKYNYKAFLPILISIFTVIAMLFMQYAIVLPDFYANFKEREAVVSQINSGELTPNESQRIQIPIIPNHPYKIYNLTLPSKYSQLSKGREADGEINLVLDEKTNKPKMVVFFNSVGRFKGGEPNYTAFIYKTDADRIDQQELFGVGNLNFYIWLLESKKIHKNWFWVDLFED